MSYADYKHLLGLGYSAGDQDCYGLCVRYYKDAYGVTLTDFARPELWWKDPKMNLIADFMFHDKWKQISANPRLLKPGDLMVFSLITGRANHCGIYVGNGMFIHHIMNRLSAEGPLTSKWTSRMLDIVRHPGVTEARYKSATNLNLLDILPDDIKRQLTAPSQT